MDPVLTQVIGMGAALGGGAAVKALSKSRSSIIHKWLSPLAAVAVAIGFESLTGQAFNVDTITAGTQAGALAGLLHSVYRGGRVQFKTKF